MILVTGGTGFLGTHLLRRLITRGQKVRAIKRITSKIFLEPAVANEIEWVQGDVLDIASLEESIDGCDRVYHCAAVVSFLPGDHDRIMKVNVEGTANVVNACLEKKIQKLLHVSSVAAIGRNRDEEVVSENTDWNESERRSNYATSKFLAEREVQRGIAEGLNAVIVNPSLIIGEGNWSSGPPHFFERVWKGMPYYTDGGTGFVAVSDVVNLMILLMESNVVNERFILNADHLSFKDFFFTIADFLKKKRPAINVKPWMMQILWRTEMIKYRLTGIKPLVTRETARAASHWSRYDASKVTKATGYQFTPLSECLNETAEKFLTERMK